MTDSLPPERTADLDVTVTSFVDVINSKAGPGLDRTCQATVAMSPNNKNKNVRVDGDTIRVSNARAPQDLRFTFISGTNPPDTYVALGIAFREEVSASASAKDPVGELNFPNANFHYPATSAVRIRDQFNPAAGKDGEATYEAYFLIQRVSDGAIGIIDPGVSNEPPT